MVDKELLEAIGQMMDQRFAEQENKLDQRFAEQENKLDQRFAEQRKELLQDMNVLLDAEFTPKFNLLAEGQSLIIERLDRVEDRLESLETKVGAHEIKLRVVE